LLGALALTSIAITWRFATRLARAYQSEHDARRTAQAALATRDELMGMVAHDLRNPLAAIRMKAALLLRSSDSETARAQAESIENVTGRMESLIKSMLDVATIEAGRFSLSRTTVAVDDVLRESVEMFENLALSRQVGLQSAADEAQLAIDGDRERTVQVLSNLLGNALKFTPQGGSVSVSARRWGDMVLFAVADTGPGIARENIPHIFERYWTRGKQGTGLGLFIAKGIVDAHGGSIWVESEPGRGATFYFSLPLAAPQRAPTRTPDEAPAAEGNAQSSGARER
jgi:signal transduction histidine kinase